MTTKTTTIRLPANENITVTLGDLRATFILLDEYRGIGILHVYKGDNLIDSYGIDEIHTDTLLDIGKVGY